MATFSLTMDLAQVSSGLAGLEGPGGLRSRLNGAVLRSSFLHGQPVAVKCRSGLSQKSRFLSKVASSVSGRTVPEQSTLRDPDSLAAEAAAALAADAADRKKSANGNGTLNPDISSSVMQTENQYILQTYARAPVVFVRGEGCKLYDAAGKEYLDMAAGIAVNILGHSDPAWVKAVAEQAGTLAHTSNLYYTVPGVQLAERLVKSSFADRAFFCNSGTEANEAAIKFARKVQRKRLETREDTRIFKMGPLEPATEFVAFSNSFHGRTMGALAVTSKIQYRSPFEPVMPGASFATFGDLESAAKAIKKGKTAGVFVEPVQGEGGIYAATSDFLRGLRRICDDTGAVLIFDEVQCGLGRTGQLWAHEAYGVTPDILTAAKPLAGGLPIGCVLLTAEVAAAMAPGDHGSTFAGNPLVCAAALAVLDRVQEPGFLENVAAKGERLRKGLRTALAGNKHLKEVRGIGLLVGVQLDVQAGPLVNACREAGLLVITAGKGDVVRMVPPLIISEEEIDFAVSVLAKCMTVLD